ERTRWPSDRRSATWLATRMAMSSAKKKLARNRFQASSMDFYVYAILVPIAVVVMMTVVAVIINSKPVVPIVRWPVIVPIVRIGSVVSIWIIAVSVVTRGADSDRNLSVRTLRGNESQSTYHQCN